MPLSPLLTPLDLPSRFPSAPEASDVLGQLQRAVLEHYRPVVFQLGAQPFQAIFSFTEREADRPVTSVIETKCHGSRFFWYLHESLELGRVQPELLGMDLVQLPQELGLAVLDLAFEKPLKALEKAGLSLKLEHYGSENLEGHVSDLGWRLELPELKVFWTGHLRSDERGLKLLLDVLASLPAEIAPGQELSQFNAFLEYGHQVVSTEALSQLKANDVLVVNDEAWKAQKATLRLGATSRAVALHQNGKWLLAGYDLPIRTLEPNYVSLTITGFPQGMTLAAIQQIQLGGELPFAVDPEKRVLIWSANQCVGEGEWIQMGEVSAVRIVELKHV